MLWRWLLFYWKAQTKYRIHSPFVFDFVENILEDRREYYAFYELEQIRQRLRSNHQKIEVTDLGAGSRTSKSTKRSIRRNCRQCFEFPFLLPLTFRTINHYQPKTILELGTSLGLSALYQHQAARQAQLITLEGCSEIAALAREQFQKQNASIELLEGNLLKRFLWHWKD